MAALREPATGCAWDIVQTHESIAPYALEEAAEVVDAIRRGDREDLRDELGDLLLQVVYHAQMASEDGAFDFGDVVEAVTTKMIRRHPHVFGDARGLPPDQIDALWARIKDEEKAERRARRLASGHDDGPPSRLDGVLPSIPALSRARALQAKAASAGFEWPDVDRALAKVREEIDEVGAALVGRDEQSVAEELGDLLLAAANLARMRGLDPEALLHSATDKFSQRFRSVETMLTEQGQEMESVDLAALEALWARVKAEEGAPPSDV